MNMKRWAMVLHFYQPPVQDLAVTKQVLESSYLPVLDLLIAHPRARVTINISACLLQQLNKLKKKAFFEKLKILIELDKVELLSGPAYHPVLPLVSDETLERQVKKTQWLFQDLVGSIPDRGFFIPELAANSELIGRLGKYCDFTIVDQAGVIGSYCPVTEIGGVRTYINQRAICDVFRTYNKALTGSKLLTWIDKQVGTSNVIVTVNDVEAFGHHYEERIDTLKELFDCDEFEFVRLCELGDIKVKAVKFFDSSWQHLPEDKHKKGAFWLWKNPENHLQAMYWDLAKQAEAMYKASERTTEGYVRDAAAEHLDMGLSSCYSYWLSNWPWWHPDLVERGAQQLVKCCRTLNIDRKQKSLVEAKLQNLLGEVWKFHWSGQVQKNYDQYEIERAKLLSNLPDLG